MDIVVKVCAWFLFFASLIAGTMWAIGEAEVDNKTGTLLLWLVISSMLIVSSHIIGFL